MFSAVITAIIAVMLLSSCSRSVITNNQLQIAADITHDDYNGQIQEMSYEDFNLLITGSYLEYSMWPIVVPVWGGDNNQLQPIIVPVWGRVSNNLEPHCMECYIGWSNYLYADEYNHNWIRENNIENLCDAGIKGLFERYMPWKCISCVKNLIYHLKYTSE